jgi:hypothetical protein
MGFDEFEEIWITGSNGVVGSSVYKDLNNLGLTVIPIQRQKKKNSYILKNEFHSKRGLVIHCGVPSHPRTRRKRRKYLENTIMLFDWAAKNNFELIFFSSHSSRSNNGSLYSRDKRMYELLAISMGFKVIRLGIFIGPKPSYINKTLNLLQKFRLTFLQKLLGSIPVCQSENVLQSLSKMTCSNNKIWGWTKSSSTAVELDITEIQTGANTTTRKNIYSYDEKKSWRIRLGDLICFLTFGFADPFINLGYDLKYYAK